MAEAKTIKRRGFLKALPLAGMAAAVPVAAIANVAPTGFDDALAHLKHEIDGAAAALSDNMPWDSRTGTMVFRHLSNCAIAMACLPTRSFEMIAAKRLAAATSISAGPYTVMLPFDLREALENSADEDEAMIMGARA